MPSRAILQEPGGMRYPEVVPIGGEPCLQDVGAAMVHMMQWQFQVVADGRYAEVLLQLGLLF